MTMPRMHRGHGETVWTLCGGPGGESIVSGAGDNTMRIWAPMEDESGHVMLHAVFRDVGGSLNTITAALTAKGVDVKRVLAFCTPSGIAIDSFATRGSHSGRRPTTSAVPSPH